MAINEFRSDGSRMPTPEPISDRPLMFFSTLVDTIDAPFQHTLDNNIYLPQANNPRSNFIATECRAMNVEVDLTVSGGNEIVYMSHFMMPCTYIANYSGIHPIIHLGIISIGDGIVTLQSAT